MNQTLKQRMIVCRQQDRFDRMLRPLKSRALIFQSVTYDANLWQKQNSSLIESFKISQKNAIYWL